MNTPLDGSLADSIGEELAWAYAELAKAGVENPQLDAELLMAYTLGCERIDVIAHPERLIPQDRSLMFRRLVHRRASREPLSYIVGRREFWKLDFDVGDGVLVPRPETETLVECVIDRLRGVENPLIADIGVGSGCVAVSLAVELPSAVVYAIDISCRALEYTARNAEKHGVLDRVKVIQGGFMELLPYELRGRFDAVVSNPPYIRSGDIDYLQPEVSEWEPREALDGGEDGMRFHREIINNAAEWLKPRGLLCLEVGFGQGEHVAEIAEKCGFVDVSIVNDLAGIARVLIARRNDENISNLS